MSASVIETRGLGKRYRIAAQRRGGYTTLRDSIAGRLRGEKKPVSDGTFWALRNLSVDVPEGQVLGIVGENGAGKSTFLKLLSRITEPTEGEVRLRGRVASLLEVGTGFHPELTGRENVFLNGVILGMKRSEVAAKLDAIVAFAGVERFLDMPVKRYSSGMYLRLAFSVAAHLEPEVLIVDEVLAVGDAEFQQRCLGRMEEEARSGRTILFVSHNMAAVRNLCDRVLHLRQGELVGDGEPESIVSAYLQSGLASGNVREWDAGHAPGSSGVALRRLAISPQDGASGELRSDLPVEVTMNLDMETVPASLVVGFDLLTSDGATVFRTCMTDGPKSGWPEFRPGRNRIRCIIPAGMLNRGHYLIAPKAWIKDTRWIFAEPAVLRFSVTLMHGESPFWLKLGPDEKPGGIAPVLEWRDIAEDR